MTEATTPSLSVAAPETNGARYLPWLLVLFAGSGASALIYEIAWYQMLQLVIGSTAVSLGVLLATFMGGLCIGSIGLPWWLRRRQAQLAAQGAALHPLRVYAALELGTGVLGLVGIWLIPLIDKLYLAGAEHGLPSMLLRGLLCACCLLPPTILMGASLPAITGWIENTPRGVAWWGLLYAGNIAGAVFGCLLAGYYLLRVFDLDIAIGWAVAINAIVAGLSFWVAARAPASAELQPDPQKPSEQPDEQPNAATGQREREARRWPVMLAIALSGCAALGAEVVWTRLLGLLLGATVYTFSLILAVFLIGLGGGSALGAWMGRRYHPRAALAWSQMALAAGVAWAAIMIAGSLPYWPINPDLSTSPWFTFQIDLVRCLWTILPAAILWGASFPLALAAADRSRGSHNNSGRLVGEVYAANTLGAIAGALAFSLFLIPWVGTRACEMLLVLISAASGLLLLIESFESERWQPGVKIAAALVAAVLLAVTVPGVPGQMIAYGRLTAVDAGESQILYSGEGRNASIAVSRWSDGTIQFHVSGKVEASTDPADMRLQRMLGHFPALFHQGPLHSVLVVGFGAGVTAGSFTRYASVNRIAICELEPLIPPHSTAYFAKQDYDVMHDPRTQIYYDDARHFVLTTPEHFDLITSDPIHPWVKGSATLYSREYFQMVRNHLNPHGVVTQWVPLYETDAATVKSEIATFFSVFPNGSIWANELNGGGYDVFLLGSNDPANAPLTINADALQQTLDSPPYAGVQQSLAEVGLGSASAILDTYAGQHRDLEPWLAGAQINRDGNLRLQYLAGLALNDDNEDAIYAAMLKYRRFPGNLITGSPETLAPLMRVLRPR